jgi:transcriptional regulator with XRE-family HTH domain
MSKIWEDLLKEFQKLGLSVRKIATETGIPEQRMYRWFRELNYPKHDDLIILEQYLSKYKGVSPAKKQGEPLTNVQETIKELKADKAYLQKMNDSLLDQLNLNSTVALKMLATQLDLTRNGHLLQIMIAANGDAKKEIELMKKMGKLSDVAQRKDAKNSK